MITGEIKSQVDAIWDTFAAGGVVNPLTVIEQMTCLIFLRRLDEEEQLNEKKANEYDPPAKIIADIVALDKERTKALKKLKAMLN